MPHYSLAASGRPDVQASDIILSRNEETGEPDVVLAVGTPVEINDEELLTTARTLANQLGYRIIEVASPEDSEEEGQGQEVGVDTVAAAPEVSDQTGESPSAPQQGDTAAQPDSTTAQFGSSETSSTNV